MSIIESSIKECIKYEGSTICVFSSQLFIIATLCNIVWGNYVESIAILALFMTSVSYHKKPTDANKIIDGYMVKFSISISILISLYNYNVLPTLATILLAIAYYNKPDCKSNCSHCNLYHAIFVHFIGFLGFMSIYYNKIR